MSNLRGHISVDFKDISAMLKELPDKFVVSDVRSVQKEQWQRVVEEAKRLVPVDTGQLQKMIMSKAGFSRKKGMVFANAGLRKIKGKERIKIQARKALGKVGKSAAEYDAYYGVFVEFGTRKMKAEPFMRPAFDKLYRDILSDYTDQLKNRLQRRLDKLNSAPKRTIK